jgi:Flp pilus assembly pilin Flp
MRAVTGAQVAMVRWVEGRRGHVGERAASLVEYALLVALIAIVCFAAVAIFGGETSSTFSRVGHSVSQT